MKKQTWLVLSLLLVAVLVIAGCGGTTTQPQPTTAQPAATTAQPAATTAQPAATTARPTATTTAAAKPGEKIELRLAHGWATTHHIHKVIEAWANEVFAATEGRVKVTIYSGGTLAGVVQLYDAMRTGTADMAWFLHGMTPGKFPMTSVIELPLMAKTSVSASQALWELYDSFPGFKNEYAGVKMLGLWTVDVGQVMTSKKQVNRLADMKGLKLRVGSATIGPIAEALGAVPILAPINDLYDMLQKGTVDGTLLGTSAVNTFKLQEIVRFMTMCNIFVSAHGMGINEASWAKISAADQKIIEGLSGLRFARISGEAFEVEAKLGRDAAAKGGVRINELSDAEMANWVNAVSGLYDQFIKDLAGKGMAGQALFDTAKKNVAKYQ
ncbi:MAG TPA: TRAP transporter substrate-binding protein [Dehalococcoidales bacterium]|nr:TRAP transporter substrate-binding protein [Dehalococcoidales bacterium]